MERQNLDEQRCQELTAYAQEMIPPSGGPPLPETIVKVGDDLLVYGSLPVRVLSNGSGPGFFVGYTEPSIFGIDGYLEWPYAEEFINDRAPLDPQETPMPVWIHEDPEPGQQQQGAFTRRNAPSYVLTIERALQHVLIQIPHDKRREVRDRLRRLLGLEHAHHDHGHHGGER